MAGIYNFTMVSSATFAREQYILLGTAVIHIIGRIFH